MSGVTVESKRGTDSIRAVEIDLDGHHVQDILEGDHAGFDAEISEMEAAREDDQIEIEVKPTTGATPSVTPRKASTGDLLSIYIQLGRYELTALDSAGLAEFDDPLRGIHVEVSAVGGA